MAVRLVLLLLEAALTERLQAEVAHQVMGVELSTHGCDAAAQDGLPARLAHAAARLVVVHLTQRLALMLKETSVHKRTETLLLKKETQMLI